MKKNSYYFVLLICLISALVSPVLIIVPEPVLADSEMLKWYRIDTPGSVTGKNDLVSPSEVNRIIICHDGKTFFAVDIVDANNTTGEKALYKSVDGGKSWSDTISQHLYKAMSPAEKNNFRIWNIAVAPDNTGFIAVVTNNSSTNLPRNIWLSMDGGNNWQNTNLSGVNNINVIDISKSNSNYIVAVGTRSGAGGGNVYTLKYPSYNGWVNQNFTADIMALKFSPNYSKDATLAVIHSNGNGTYLSAGIHDTTANITSWTTIYNNPLEITTSGAGTSPKVNQIISASLQFPSDFHGQAPSFRRYYLSIDAPVYSAGIYRFDDTMGYWLMPATNTKRIFSIAYWGTYSAGKLLAGEVHGNVCAASVMTWLTDSPITCPVPCWYQAIKPPTGAAGNDNCIGSGYGNAQVAWSPDGLTAYAGTASSGVLVSGANWPTPYLTGKSYDESSFSISRNNGQTWNQISLIDTKINVFTDIAPSPDCSTVYLASTNNNINCAGFDSIWKSQSSPIGAAWERILCKPTTQQPCASGQTNTSILRLAGDKVNGQYIFWAATGTRALWWSADHGDWWGSMNPRFNIQDVAAEDSNTVYILSVIGQLQKLTYNNTGWTSSNTISTGLDTGYSIATAYTGITPDNYKGHIVVGGTGTGDSDAAYSEDGGKTFTVITKQLPTRDNTMVFASSSYRSDGYILAINSGGMYAWGIYSGIITDWETWWGGPSWPSPVTGLAISRNYGFYFPTPASLWSPATPYIRWSAASAGLDTAISLGTQPTTRFRICGGIEYGDLITVYAIDQRTYNPPVGGVWCYKDCMAWQGPLPLDPISLNPVNFDSVSGRAGEVNLKWEPLCLSKSYRIQISKDIDFTTIMADIGKSWSGPFYTPSNLDKPALIIPPGGGIITDVVGNNWTVPPLEANHTYYWRVMVKNVLPGDNIDSPWSWRESFIVKQGLRVTMPYQGPYLLAPDDDCTCHVDAPACFSWTPFTEAISYRFELSEYPDMSQLFVSIEVPTTSYQYQNKLKPNNAYFWRVKAEKPYPSEWSPTFSFITMAEKKQPTVTDRIFLKTPPWVFIIIALGSLLIISILILIMRQRQSY
jgi:hypothetical protein